MINKICIYFLPPPPVNNLAKLNFVCIFKFHFDLIKSTATAWPPMSPESKDKTSKETSDVFDFRMLDWFVGGATSSKDLAIVIDSASFSSKKIRNLAISTTKAILDTLGPNDYVNVYRYGENAEEIVQCFKDSLVQASPENLKELKNALHTIQPESVTNVSAAIGTAFEILYKYNKSSLGSQCNQAIMLITSNTEAPSKELIKRYNWPHMPVRIFTYLVGGDKSPELKEAACDNKGKRLKRTYKIRSRQLRNLSDRSI